MAFETPLTTQTRIDTGEKVQICGDGTVPYASLNYCAKWKDQMDLSIKEIPGIRHRDILDDIRFHEIVLDYLCEPPTAETSNLNEFPPNTENLEIEDAIDQIRVQKRAIGAKVQEIGEKVEEALRPEQKRITIMLDLLDGDNQICSHSPTVQVNRKFFEGLESGKLLATFFTSLDPSIHYDEYLKKHAAFESKKQAPILQNSFSADLLATEPGLTGVLRLNINRCDGIQPADVNGSADPYCIVKLGSSMTNLIKVAKTEVIMGTLQPVWNQSFIVDIKNVNVIQLKVKDWDRLTGNDTCGRASCDLRTLKPEKEKLIKLNLIPTGTITFSVQYSPEGSL